MEVRLQRDYLAKTMKTSDQNKKMIELVFLYSVPVFQLSNQFDKTLHLFFL